MAPDAQLLDNAVAQPVIHARAHQLLDVKVFHRKRIERAAAPSVSRHRQLALPKAVAPLRMTIADALHLKRQDRFERNFFPLATLVQQYADGGGNLLVCPICFNARKLDQAQLVANAQLGGATPLWQWIGDEDATVFSY